MKRTLRAKAGKVSLRWRIEAIDVRPLHVELAVAERVVLHRRMNRWKELDAQQLAAELAQQKAALGFVENERAATSACQLDDARVLREAKLEREGAKVVLSLDAQPLQHPSVPEVLVALLATPQQPALEELVLTSESGGEIDLDPYFHILASFTSPTLRRLTILHSIWQDPEDDHSSALSYAGELAPMLRAHPQLVSLELSVAFWRELAPSTHERLERLSLKCGGTQKHLLRWLAASQFPALRELSLDCSARNGFNRGDGDELLTALIEREQLPALEVLELVDCAASDELRARLSKERAEERKIRVVLRDSAPDDEEGDDEPCP